MKTHHYIFLTALLFCHRFYDQDIGLNLGILGIVYAVLTLFRTPEKNKTRTLYVLLQQVFCLVLHLRGSEILPLLLRWQAHCFCLAINRRTED